MDILFVSACALVAVVIIGMIAAVVVWQVISSASKSKVKAQHGSDRLPLPVERRPMPVSSTTQLLDTLRTRSLLEGAALREAESLAEQIADPGAFGAELVK